MYVVALHWKIALPIGVAVGFVAALITTFAALKVPEKGEGGLIQVNCERPECFDFQFTGIVKSISDDSLTIAQPLNGTGTERETVITWHTNPSSPLFWCTGDGPECAGTTYDAIPEGSPVCVYARLNPDGSFDVSRFFFNTVCTLQVPPSLR